MKILTFTKVDYSLIIYVLLTLTQFIIGQQLKGEDCDCRTGISRRIVNGGEVHPNSVPWQISLAFFGSHICGGTLINHRFVMTSYHCVSGIAKSQLNQLKIRVGLHYLNDPEIRSKTYVAKQIFYDSRYNQVRADDVGDFAMIEVHGSIPFDKNVRPACLPAEDSVEHYDDQVGSLRAIGWGATRRSAKPERLSNVLKEAFFNYVKCADYLICIKPVKSMDSICAGDSGGGLIHQKANSKISRVVGIAQFVAGEPNRDGKIEFCTGDGGYARVSFYKTIIRQIIGENYCRA